MKTLLYGHGGSGNHGCEAIVRSTTAILNKAFSGTEISLVTIKPKEDHGFLDGERLRLLDFSSRTKNLDYLLSLRHISIQDIVEKGT